MNEKQSITKAWKWDSVPSGPGVLNIRRKSDGKSYFVAAADMRQRAYDAYTLLSAGEHHSRELQVAWSAASDDFEIVTVEIVRSKAFLPSFKQVHIERARTNCWNRKNSVRANGIRWTQL